MSAGRCPACGGEPYACHSKECAYGQSSWCRMVIDEMDAAQEEVESLERQVGIEPGTWKRMQRQAWAELVGERLAEAARAAA